MAKGNLFIGQARGSVGSVTFTVLDGKQVAKARNRQPRNPRAVSQMISRIVLNTVSKAYSRMQAICNHSFESRSGNARNQQRFNQVNIALLRDKLGDLVENPTEQEALDSIVASFSFKDDFNMSLNEYIMSEGTLSPLNVVRDQSESFGLALMFPQASNTAPSYQDIVDALGCQRGDQLTFIGLGHDFTSLVNFDQIESFEYARVILEPASGDMSLPFFTGNVGEEVINDPSPKNEGTVLLSPSHDGELNVNGFLFSFDMMVYPENGMAAGTVILSRFENNKWRRSTQRLVYTKYNSSGHLLNNATFGAAYASYLQGESSGLYLNGSPTAAAAVPASVGVISSAQVGNENWPAAGNQVQVSTTYANIVIYGSGLTPDTVKVIANNAEQTLTFVGDQAAHVSVRSSQSPMKIMLNGAQYGGLVTGGE